MLLLVICCLSAVCDNFVLICCCESKRKMLQYLKSTEVMVVSLSAPSHIISANLHKNSFLHIR